MAGKMAKFLREQYLCAEAYDLQEQTDIFLSEMQRGLRGEKSSLYMIPTFVTSEANAVADQTVIVLDAGGTNLRVGAVTFSGGAVQAVDFEKFPLPGTEKPLTCEEFFDAIAEKLAPYLDKSEKVGFCFSYAADCMENKDAKLVRFCKEVQVTGADGVEVCKALKEAIARRGVKKTYRFCQLNDTVATQLGGMAASQRESYDGYVGFILGTGTNACYTEKTENIIKYTGTAYREKEMIINMEAGCYALFPKGAADKAVDAASAIPGDHTAEKLLSGAYLGSIFTEAVRLAKKEGLLSRLAEEMDIHASDLSAFGQGQGAIRSFPQEDHAALGELIEGIYSRNARLLAIEFSAIALHTGCGKEKPLCIVMEGSTYWKTPRLQELLQKELKNAEKTFGIKFEIIGAENPTLTGAAFAAISNT